MQTERADGQSREIWGAYRCTHCGSLVTARANYNPGTGKISDITKTYPEERKAHDDIPPIAKRFLQQAHETLHAPDAAAVMAGSAVDAMLKKLGYEKGSVYTRIEKAVEDKVLTQGMGEWAHSVRLGSNRPRHADEENPHVSSAEAQRSVDFAEALGQFLFVLTARIDRGLEDAKNDEQDSTKVVAI